MAGALTADAALADLLEVSDTLRSIALFGPDGAVLAEIGQLGSDARGVLEAADDADRKSTRLNSSHVSESRMPSSA